MLLRIYFSIKCSPDISNWGYGKVSKNVISVL